MVQRREKAGHEELEKQIVSLKTGIQLINSGFSTATTGEDELALCSVRNASILKVFENCRAIASYVSRCNRLMGESLERRVASTSSSYSRTGSVRDAKKLQSWIKSELVPVVMLSESLGHIAALNISSDRRSDTSHTWKLAEP